MLSNGEIKMTKRKMNNQDLYIDCLEFMCSMYSKQIRQMQKDIYWLLLYLQGNLKDVDNERNDINEK